MDSPWINEVELFHPTVADLPFGSCERCSKGFQSVASAGVTLFQQIVAGDPGQKGPMLPDTVVAVDPGIQRFFVATMVVN